MKNTFDYPAKELPKLALTAGEPAGVGPELITKLAASDMAADLIAIADSGLIEIAAKIAGVALTLIPYDQATVIHNRKKGTLRIVEQPLYAPAQPGQLDIRNASYVLDTLERAAKGASSGEFDAIVTAPAHKGIINDAGIPFTGHTEFFAERAHCDVVMMLAAGDLRVALATTHIPLAQVPQAITREALTCTLEILHRDLITRFGLATPCIAVLGLNPHAGESGHLGREEIEMITPVLNELQSRGMNLIGPLPADTAFVPSHLAHYDAVLAMYHDQGLPVLKYAGFGHAVNVTLGLPYIRTSVDHGTALDIAGSGKADPGSLFAAAQLAIDLAHRKRS